MESSIRGVRPIYSRDQGIRLRGWKVHRLRLNRHLPKVDRIADHAHAQQVFDNAFKVQWEMFLRYGVKDKPWRFSLLEGAKGVPLAEKGLESWAKRAWVDLPELKA